MPGIARSRICLQLRTSFSKIWRHDPKLTSVNSDSSVSRRRAATCDLEMASTQLKPDRRQGFDYTYDRRLYDRLCDGHARPVSDHFLTCPCGVITCSEWRRSRRSMARAS